MTFVAVDEVKKRFPNKKVILLSSADYERSEDEKGQYKFEILPFNTGINLELLGGLYKLLWNAKGNKKDKKNYEPMLTKLRSILKNTDAIIDISGYALSSQFGAGRSFGYLSRIMLAKKYNIKMYLMPQSFGPFSYSGVGKVLINSLMKQNMKYPEVVYAREQEGFELLEKQYSLKNIKKSFDLVLLNKGVDLTNVYNSVPILKNFDEVEGVAIVPNMKNFKHGNTSQVMALYDNIINKLIGSGKNVYLIRHSFEDIEACKMIKERFKTNNKVIMYGEDMSCFEFDKLVQRFDFIIGSRFHSIVHAYKNSIPCIALGWATKYHELLKAFKQEDYIFDVRGDLQADKVERALDKMLMQHQSESNVIKDSLIKLQNHNVFDVIKK